MAIDDHSWVGFSQVLGNESSKSACAFLLSALRYEPACAFAFRPS